MRDLLFILAAFIVTITTAYTQAPDILWTKTYGGAEWEIGYSINVTNDGGFIIAGQTNSYGAGGNDMYLVKINAEGDTLWTRTYGGPGADVAFSVQQSLDGGYILAGRTTPSGSSDPDVYLVKTDATGDTLWTRTEGGIDDDEAVAVIQCDDGYFILAGTTRSYGQGNADIYFLEYTPNASSGWDDTFGGYANDYGYSVQVTDDGYIIAASTGSFGNGNFDAWLVHIDWEYEILWHQTFGGSAGDHAYDVQLTTDGGFIGAGSTSSYGPGDFSYFLFKASANGDSLWAKVFGGTEKDECKSVKQTPDGGYIMAGSSKSFGTGDFDWFLVRTNANGDTLWTKVIGGPNTDECFDIQLTSEGGYIIAGSTKSYGAGNTDFWVVRLESDAVDIEELNPPLENQLFQLIPNPVNSQITFNYSLFEKSAVSIRIFDLFGKEVKTITKSNQPSGSFNLKFNVSDLTPGIYFCKLKTNEKTYTIKMVKL